MIQAVEEDNELALRLKNMVGESAERIQEVGLAVIETTGDNIRIAAAKGGNQVGVKSIGADPHRLKVVMNSYEAVIAEYLIAIGTVRVKIGSQRGGLAATGKASNN